MPPCKKNNLLRLPRVSFSGPPPAFSPYPPGFTSPPRSYPAWVPYQDFSWQTRLPELAGAGDDKPQKYCTPLMGSQNSCWVVPNGSQVGGWGSHRTRSFQIPQGVIIRGGLLAPQQPDDDATRLWCKQRNLFVSPEPEDNPFLLGCNASDIYPATQTTTIQITVGGLRGPTALGNDGVPIWGQDGPLPMSRVPVPWYTSPPWTQGVIEENLFSGGRWLILCGIDVAGFLSQWYGYNLAVSYGPPDGFNLSQLGCPSFVWCPHISGEGESLRWDAWKPDIRVEVKPYQELIDLKKSNIAVGDAQCAQVRRVYFLYQSEYLDTSGRGLYTIILPQLLSSYILITDADRLLADWSTTLTEILNGFGEDVIVEKLGIVPRGPAVSLEILLPYIKDFFKLS